MSVNTANLAMGPGELYVGDFGAPEPLPQEVNVAPAGSAWTDVGGTVGGITLTVVNTWKELDVDQVVEAPERRITKREVQIKTQLAEVTFVNLSLVLAGGTTVTDEDFDYETYEPDDINSGDSPDYRAILFDGSGAGGLRRRVVVRKVVNTDNLDIAAHPENQTVFPVTFVSHYVSPSVRSWKVFAASAAS